MIVIVILFVVLVAVGLLFWRGTKGVARSLDQLDRPIRGLLRQGYNGGFLVINRYRKTPFVQLRKYIRKPGDYGIELAFPLVNWSVPFQSKLKRLCAERGIVSVRAGHGTRAEGAYFTNDNFELMNDYARQRLGEVEARESHNTFTNSCGAYAKPVIEARGIELPSMLDSRPDNYVEKAKKA